MGNRVVDEINRVTAVTPGALTALALLSQPLRGIAHAELVDLCAKLLMQLSTVGARVPPTALTASGQLRSQSIREAVDMFIRAELVAAHAPELGAAAVGRKKPAPAGDGALYSVIEEKRLALDTSKNIIVHFFVNRALVAVAMLMQPGPHPIGAVRERVQSLSRLFKFEFRFHADATFDTIFERTLAAMRADGIVAQSDGVIDSGAGSGGWPGTRWLEIYVAILKNFIEGYRVAARSLSNLVKGPVSQKEAVKRALAVGHRMYLAREISRREAVSKPLIENAYLAFADQGYLEARNGKLELAASFASLDAVKAIEGRIANFLGEAGP
jgi:glycerol-3-phosphate O-acyltransferase